jgi:hypothetical protein
VDESKLDKLAERNCFPDEDKKQKPVLILAIHQAWIIDLLVPLPGREWFRYVHQCGGVACHQLVFAAATELTPKSDAMLKGMRRISDEYHASNLFRPVSVDDLVHYRSVVREHLQVDCNRDYETFDEAIYPIDLDHIRDLTSDSIPENLNDLGRWKYQRVTPALPFGLWILGPNSD